MLRHPLRALAGLALRRCPVRLPWRRSPRRCGPPPTPSTTRRSSSSRARCLPKATVSSATGSSSPSATDVPVPPDAAGHRGQGAHRLPRLPRRRQLPRVRRRPPPLAGRAAGRRRHRRRPARRHQAGQPQGAHARVRRSDRPEARRGGDRPVAAGRVHGAPRRAGRRVLLRHKRLVSLSGAVPRDAMLAAPVALHVAFGRVAGTELPDGAHGHRSPTAGRRCSTPAG